MREKIFRAWDRTNRVMVAYDDADYGAAFNFEGWNVSDIYAVNSLLDNAGFYYMQYIGLRDKNMVRIFDQDVLKRDDGIYFTVSEGLLGIKFGLNYIACGFLKRNGEDVGNDGVLKDYEVVGNMFQMTEDIENGLKMSKHRY